MSGFLLCWYYKWKRPGQMLQLASVEVAIPWERLFRNVD